MAHGARLMALYRHLHISSHRVLQRDSRAHFYAYRTSWQGRRQTGLACVAALAGYENGRIRRHELTTPVKETDRVRQIEALNTQTGPVMMAYPHAPEIDRLLKRATERDPDVAVTADDDVTHELWVIADAAPIATNRMMNKRFMVLLLIRLSATVNDGLWLTPPQVLFVERVI